MLPPTDPARECLERLDALRTELADLAYVLESRGRLDAADVATGIAGRVAEIRTELSGVEKMERQRALSGDRN